MITLDIYKNVEDLMDLFDERYTRSDITGQEYDTAEKIRQKNGVDSTEI